MCVFGTFRSHTCRERQDPDPLPVRRRDCPVTGSRRSGREWVPLRRHLDVHPPLLRPVRPILERRPERRYLEYRRHLVRHPPRGYHAEQVVRRLVEGKGLLVDVSRSGGYGPTPTTEDTLSGWEMRYTLGATRSGR